MQEASWLMLNALTPVGGLSSRATAQHVGVSSPAHVLLCFGLQLVAGQPAVADHNRAFGLIRRRVVSILLLRCMLCAWESGSGVHPAGSGLASEAEAAGSIG